MVYFLKVCAALGLPAKMKGIRIEQKVDVCHEWVVGDAMRFRQVLVNLISNAIKFTPEHGTVTVTVTQDDTAQPCSTRVDVADTGKFYTSSAHSSQSNIWWIL